MESYEYNEVIEKMTEHIQFLTIELVCALYDLSGYMGEWQREEIRKLPHRKAISQGQNCNPIMCCHQTDSFISTYPEVSIHPYTKKTVSIRILTVI